MTNLEKLRDYESKGEYLFHGSGDEIEEFEPRQAFNFTKGQKIPDGDPAVFASDILDYAIFMALVNKKNLPSGSFSGVHIKNDSIEFSVSTKTMESLNEKMNGFVYVFKKNNFQHKKGKEYICLEKIRPIDTIPVIFYDFKQPIKIKEESEV